MLLPFDCFNFLDAFCCAPFPSFPRFSRHFSLITTAIIRSRPHCHLWRWSVCLFLFSWWAKKSLFGNSLLKLQQFYCIFLCNCVCLYCIFIALFAVSLLSFVLQCSCCCCCCCRCCYSLWSYVLQLQYQMKFPVAISTVIDIIYHYRSRYYLRNAGKYISDEKINSVVL